MPVCRVFHLRRSSSPLSASFFLTLSLSLSLSLPLSPTLSSTLSPSPCRAVPGRRGRVLSVLRPERRRRCLLPGLPAEAAAPGAGVQLPGGREDRGDQQVCGARCHQPGGRPPFWCVKACVGPQRRGTHGVRKTGITHNVPCFGNVTFTPRLLKGWTFFKNVNFN